MGEVHGRGKEKMKWLPTSAHSLTNQSHSQRVRHTLKLVKHTLKRVRHTLKPINHTLKPVKSKKEELVGYAFSAVKQKPNRETLA